MSYPFPTISDQMKEMRRIDELDEPERSEEARKFMEEYRAVNEYADSNIGYITGYFDQETMGRMLALFDTSHPVFGTRNDVSPAEAFAAGQKIGEEMVAEAKEKSAWQLVRETRDVAAWAAEAKYPPNRLGYLAFVRRLDEALAAAGQSTPL